MIPDVSLAAFGRKEIEIAEVNKFDILSIYTYVELHLVA